MFGQYTTYCVLFMCFIVQGDKSKWSGELEVPTEPVVVFALDSGPRLDSHVFSTVAALSSVVHFSENPESLRFVLLLTIPEDALEILAEAICAILDSAVGQFYFQKKTRKKKAIPSCKHVYFKDTPLGQNKTVTEPDCIANYHGLEARITLVQFPIMAKHYPREVSELFELFCCSQRRYSMSRPELARSLGNHARFHAHITLLFLGVRRALFLDADILARVDIISLYSTSLTKVRFVAAARRCAQKRARYKPHFKFNDELIQSYGLRGNALLINAGVLVVDLQAYCHTRLLDSMKIILRKHVAGPPLWRDGNNQPPFTIAAARHITYVHPGWNVRLGDAKGQVMINRAHSRANRKRHRRPSTNTNSNEEECTHMLDDPYILHAHFNPCSALPSRLCPSTSSAPKSTDDDAGPNSNASLIIGKGGLTIPRLLKVAAAKARKIASTSSKELDPCQCSDVKRLTPSIHRHRGRGRHRRRSSNSSRKEGTSSTSASSSSDDGDDENGGEQQEEDDHEQEQRQQHEEEEGIGGE
mmetsp:Transcript_13244/g.17672  ORF Transcript_13244/g.17672 Transcript_13244/m.17672 type:complete len:529 (-) Transcript_13244:2-1588(-)